MNSDEFRKSGHALVEWIAEYLEHSDRYPVLSRVKPRDIVDALPRDAPEEPDPFEAVMADFERILVPGLTHWNHPGSWRTSPSPAARPACSPISCRRR